MQISWTSHYQIVPVSNTSCRQWNNFLGHVYTSCCLTSYTTFSCCTCLLSCTMTVQPIDTPYSEYGEGARRMTRYCMLLQDFYPLQYTSFSSEHTIKWLQSILCTRVGMSIHDTDLALLLDVVTQQHVHYILPILWYIDCRQFVC